MTDTRDDPTVLVWTDVETTGVDPIRDNLLEIAVVLTDTDLVPITDGFHSVVKYHAKTAEGLRNKSDPYVRDMHDRTGLWHRLSKDDAIPLSELDGLLHNHLTVQASKWLNGETSAPLSDSVPRVTYMLAGNSIRLDMNFIEQHLPSMYSLLSYRTVDMTAVSNVCNWWFGASYYTKRKDHSALADIRESISEARGVRSKLKAMMVPGASATETLNADGLGTENPAANNDEETTDEDRLSV